MWKSLARARVRQAMPMVAKSTSYQIRGLLDWEVGRDMLSNVTIRTFNIFLYYNKYERPMEWNLNVSVRLGVCTSQSSPEEQNQQKLYSFFQRNWLWESGG